VATLDLSNRSSTHVRRLLHDLLQFGWSPVNLPRGANIPRNRPLLELRMLSNTIRLRVSIFKVSGSGRGKPHERRIEITTTYSSSLEKSDTWKDVILGYDEESDLYVGVDPRRLDLGGDTHNASSFVDASALKAFAPSEILIRPRPTRSLDSEYQAIFAPANLTEYLFNFERVHEGNYLGQSSFVAPRRRKPESFRIDLPENRQFGSVTVLELPVSKRAKKDTVVWSDVEAFEREELDPRRKISPKQLDAILKKCKQVGEQGEVFVYEYERQRLRKSGRNDLANRVIWVSETNINRGYDIESFETDGAPRFIEVKSTIGKDFKFPISKREWHTAKNKREEYWIYRVVEIFTKPRIVVFLQDPVGAEAEGRISRSPDGWVITIL
jgi:hypothetical protein